MMVGWLNIPSKLKDMEVDTNYKDEGYFVTWHSFSLKFSFFKTGSHRSLIERSAFQHKQSLLFLFICPDSVSTVLILHFSAFSYLHRKKKTTVLRLNEIIFLHKKEKKKIMAIYSSNPSNNWTLSLKILLISTGVLSIAVALKLSAPVVADFVASEVPSFWSFVLSWLKPPYLYVLINGIIISILASSKLQQKHDDPLPPQSAAAVTAEEVKISDGGVRTDFAVYGGVVLTGYGYDPSEVAKISAVATVESTVYTPAERLVETRVSEAEKENREPAGLQRKDSALEYFFPNENEKPPVSVRFGHRKAAKASPEGGKALRVAKPKRQDTLESTWKTITEGRPIPLTRQLKKSDTWESHMRRGGGGGGVGMQNDQSTPPPAATMKKSETSNRSSNPPSLSPSPGSGKLRKEPSLSQDELNRRVEAFIKKFNEDMRLQRQESLNQYQEMISRGAHY